jgi:hypothetical protein
MGLHGLLTGIALPLLPTYDWNENCHTADPAEHTALLFRKADIHSPIELVRYPRAVFAGSLVDSKAFGPRRIEPQAHVRDVKRLACNKSKHLQVCAVHTDQ